MTSAPSTQLPAARTPGRLWAVMIAIAVVLFTLDRWTKHLALHNLNPADPPAFFGGRLKLLLTFNSGAAFSMGENFTIGLSVVATVAFIGVVGWVWPRVRNLLQAITAGLLVAGISGNLTDRLLRPPGPFRGEVVDFVSVKHFAIFNVADMCITCAAILFIIMAFRVEPAPAQASCDPGESPENDVAS